MIVNLRMVGRFGNQLFQYAFAHAYAKRYGLELRTQPWIGEELFELPAPVRIQERFTTVRSELDLDPDERPSKPFELNGYCQNQRAMIYTRSEVRELFRWKQAVRDVINLPPDPLLAHLRRGDYLGYGYPVVSIKSYERACKPYGLSLDQLVYISEESPTLGYEPVFVTDFYRLSQSHILLRANSSFSWWAATLADPTQQIYSPVIDGLAGGFEHDVLFVPGNHPRFTNLHFVTDLFLKP